jgi:hypothetical protein
MNRLFVHLPALTTLLAVTGLLLYGPIAQLPDYHEFADRRAIHELANAADVLSNAGFAFVGLWGMLRLWPVRRRPELAAGWSGYCLFLIALVLVAAGSSFYHLAPDNARLVWDRLPIAFACAGLLAGVRAETGPGINGRLLACMLAIAGAFSVWWWYFTEQAGHGDLRFYLLLQGLALLLIPLWHAIYRAPRSQRVAFGLAAALYALSKAAELNDHALLVTLRWVSGHTLKHLLATAAAALVVVHLVNRVHDLPAAHKLKRWTGSRSTSILPTQIGSMPPLNPQSGPMKTGKRLLEQPSDNRYGSPIRLYAGLLWLLSFLFTLRVLGQALQRWLPQPFLPPFNAFQGSGLPYWLLLSAQLGILAVMVHVSLGVQAGTLTSSRRTGNALAWFGQIYMAGSLLRIAIGLALPAAPAWFSTWIPAFFHVVLAGFVLTLSSYFRYQARLALGEIQQ